MTDYEAYRKAVRALIEFHEQAVIALKEEIRKIDKIQHTENQLQFDLEEATK